MNRVKIYQEKHRGVKLRTNHDIKFCDLVGPVLTGVNTIGHESADAFGQNQKGNLF